MFCVRNFKDFGFLNTSPDWPEAQNVLGIGSHRNSQWLLYILNKAVLAKLIIPNMIEW